MQHERMQLGGKKKDVRRLKLVLFYAKQKLKIVFCNSESAKLIKRRSSKLFHCVCVLSLSCFSTAKVV